MFFLAQIQKAHFKVGAVTHFHLICNLSLMKVDPLEAEQEVSSFKKTTRDYSSLLSMTNPN